jgi:hypothetical protein
MLCALPHLFFLSFDRFVFEMTISLTSRTTSSFHQNTLGKTACTSVLSPIRDRRSHEGKAFIQQQALCCRGQLLR